MYARPTRGQEILSFGVSGKLWREVLVLYDRQTRSLWSQRESRAIAGPLAGSALDVIASEVTDWQSWRAAHPETTVVIKPRSAGFLERRIEDWDEIAAGRSWPAVGAAFLAVAILGILVDRWRRHRP